LEGFCRFSSIIVALVGFTVASGLSLFRNEGFLIAVVKGVVVFGVLKLVLGWVSSLVLNTNDGDDAS
jgi:hypothetical protein